ncbi:GPW/gp25 family protein [Ruegeria meonggei]|uniref:GPW/gp25 family protein n=1 Tax=Ruegeria meonggei TaxID=1446476 RepID=UPI00366CF52B
MSVLRPDTQGFPAFQGRGWRFGRDKMDRPGVTCDKRWGRVEMSTGLSDIAEAVYLIIATSKGSRVMRPDFGCGIHDMTLSSPDSQTRTRIKAEIKEALRRFEARIDVTGVDVSGDNDVNGKLRISVDYRVRTTNQRGNIVYPFYFREGA